MKYKICKLRDGNGTEWYQVKKKGWLFWRWVKIAKGSPEWPVLITLTFFTFEQAQFWIKDDIKYINSCRNKKKIIECIDYE